MRSFARLGSYLSLEDGISFGGPGVKVSWNDQPGSTLDFTVGGSRAASVSSTGGTLHGEWLTESETGITTSDRRLKQNIQPLFRTIAESGPAKRSADAPQMQQSAQGATAQRASVVDWVLRELRPVSYSFRHGADAKQERYGFVAQELEGVLPGLVRGEGDEEKSVVYQDFVALITLASQSLQESMDLEDARLDELERKVFEFARKMKRRTGTQVELQS